MFRPPFFENFHEESDKGPKLTSANFPSRYIQGVGYDYSAINGAMLIGKHGSLWGVRVQYFAHNRWLDNDDFLLATNPSCANTVDGSFARFATGSLSVKWVRHNDNSLIICVSALRRMRVRVIFYPCYGYKGELSIEGSQVRGRSPHMGIIPGDIQITDANAVFKNRYLVIDDKQREFFRAVSYSVPSDTANGAFNEGIMEFVINKRQPSVYLFAMVGDEDIFDVELPRFDKLVNQIETAELRYGVNKTMGSGALGAPAEQMFSSMLWSRIYYPYLLTEIFSPKRSLLDNNFDISGAEENCAAILGSYADPNRAVNQLSFTADDKMLAVISAWHVFVHAEDKSEVKFLFEKLRAIYPADPELVLNRDGTKNEVAYEWTDSPLKELFNPQPMYSLDLSCIRLLAFDLLERMAKCYGDESEYVYSSARIKMIELINQTFWSDSDGMYVNRYESGQWASKIGATSFYPLVAGAVDTAAKLSCIVNNLTDPKKFWGEYIIPTLAISDREYGKKSKPDNNGKRTPPFLKYRGSIVPYVNYIIYHGLSRYGLDELAGEFAKKSTALWTANEIGSVENYSLYLPSGKRVAKREYLSSNGNMLALIGLQELIDVEYYSPFSEVNAIRFGTFVAGTHSLSNIKLCGKSYNIEVSDNVTTLIANNVNIFRADGGKAVVRGFRSDNEGGCEFLIDSHQNVSIHLNLPIGSRETVKYFFIVPVGKTAVRASHGMVNLTPIEQV